MNDAIKLLQVQLLLSRECLTGLQAIGKALTENTNGSGVTEAVQAIEPILTRLNLLANREASFLAQNKASSLNEYIAAKPQGIMQDRALKLLAEASHIEDELGQKLKVTQELLKRSKAFIDYHINVITQTAANDTYTPPGAAELENRRKIKMFDANV